MIILSTISLIIIILFTIINIFSFIHDEKPNLQWIIINAIIGIICINCIGVLYNEFKSDMKVLYDVSII